MGIPESISLKDSFPSEVPDKTDLSFFFCLACKADLLLKVFEPEGSAPTKNVKDVKEGVLFCPSCKTFYPISENIPFLLDSGYYAYFDIQSFLSKWRSKFDFENYKLLNRKTVPEKLKQLNFYNTDAESYDDLVVDSTFWKACDWNSLHGWVEELPKDSIVLDMGCGSGRCSIPLAQKGRHVFATDISIGMLRKAIAKTRDAGVGNITYFLADAEDLPVKPGLFSTVVSYGMLHHASDPVAIIKNVKRLLRPGGTFCILENHASPVRPVFDLLMKVWKLWNEEAGAQPLFKIEELRELIRSNGMKDEIRTTVFLPPHLFNLMSYELAKKVLFATDWVFGHIPLVNNFGGQLIVKATKAESI